ncbi:MAG: N-6 DNA methylase [Candidatus Omnitrophota bacterium]|nr:N-6 DNA methylase [Candidatus Omnitrophota bacterium]
MQSEKLIDLPLYMRVSREKTNGVVYTPLWIVELILNKVGYEKSIIGKKIVDPACGEGNFLIVIVKRLLQQCKKDGFLSNEIKKTLHESIYGFEIDKDAIVRCKINLDNIAESFGIQGVKWNILNYDSLDKIRTEKYFNYFDYVVGNPPYVRIQHLGEVRRRKIQRDWSFCVSGSTDIYIAFFELGLNLLNERGRLGYITPNTYFRTETAKSLRYYLVANNLIKEIVDFKHYQVFDNATTYSAITILDANWKKVKFLYYEGGKENIQLVDEIEYSNINHNIWILSSNDNLKRIKEIENKGIALGKIAKIHVGVTTLADEFYIFKDPIIRGNKAVIKLKDGREYLIERDMLRPIVKASVLKVANENQNRYIIFPYKKISGKHVIIPEVEFKKAYPDTYAYFSAIKQRLQLRDKGELDSKEWYAFGRSQGLDTSWGRKILVPPLGLKPNFIVWEKEEYTFYAGYCIKFDGDLHWLAKQLNSKDMEFYIKHVARDYQNGYKSYAKSFITNFGIVGYKEKSNEDLPIFISSDF